MYWLVAAIVSLVFGLTMFVRLLQVKNVTRVHIDMLRRDRDAYRAAWDEANNHARASLDAFTSKTVALTEQLRSITRERNSLASMIGLEHRGKLLRWQACLNGERAQLTHVGHFDYWKNKDGQFAWGFFREGQRDPVYLTFASSAEECKLHAEMYAHSLAGDVDDSFMHKAQA